MMLLNIYILGAVAAMAFCLWVFTDDRRQDTLAQAPRWMERVFDVAMALLVALMWPILALAVLWNGVHFYFMGDAGNRW